MKERQILFSAPMVRAILDGRKTQTRRVIKPRHDFFVEDGIPYFEGYVYDSPECVVVKCPYGQPSDRLWVRESWRTVSESDHEPPRRLNYAHRIWYEADIPHQPGFGKLRPGMFMPRWMSRITLEITGVRIERLQDISKRDAEAEGVERDSDGWRDYQMPSTQCCMSARDSFRSLWGCIHGSGSWDANPWVWVISFKNLEACLED